MLPRFHFACHFNDELDIRWLPAGLPFFPSLLVSLSHGPAASKDIALDESHIGEDCQKPFCVSWLQTAVISLAITNVTRAASFCSNKCFCFSSCRLLKPR